ncbi:MAG: Rap1a/Tai family immunity protein [Gammaproteobacteria bacterium]|nr:Rap1a/Tai family immunity protein [Gammaproteobacteria bacterium]
MADSSRMVAVQIRQYSQGVVMIIRVVVLGLALIVPSVGNAGFYTGNELMQICDQPTNNVSAYNQCVKYLAGIADANESLLMRTLPGDKGFFRGFVAGPFCAPNGIELKQLRQVFLKYMYAEPQHWHLNAGDRALGAFRSAWPCPD